ncbi:MULTISPECIES: asparaginase [unclassified Rhodococcus (in: high G+C Gram-positive bacteria)]|uniref:asparaginase n=1 Tax=unclassified Rhodococcus (in: high G+C Gram-positive bacteria) TaxID=192944 RepID=UPI0007BB2389|nr:MULTISPECIES: asparaginase [unclassified Rhodococcus (in: high G+C Gram-positive bacteria)]KZF08205.1 L-asparaginase [Rhodococcus sp. EPR-147]KZF09995.1 L-asparaginase [Rhodococcus sp. EPR-279]
MSDHVALLTTGGTIASSRDEHGVSRPVAGVGVDVDGVAVREVMSKDSSALDFADLDTIRTAVADALAEDGCVGVVVLHGTDTMEESALYVDLFHDDERPVVFTGAQRTADHADPDGPGNIAAAVAAAQSERGVLIAFGGRLLPARGAVKKHTTELDAFRSAALPRPKPLPWKPIAGVRVDIVALYPGADGLQIDACRQAGASGIVLQALGSGNTNAAVVHAVKEAVTAGVHVVVTTRVPFGETSPTYGGGGGGHDLVDAGAVFSRELRAGQARIQLAALVATGASDVAVHNSFS